MVQTIAVAVTVAVVVGQVIAAVTDGAVMCAHI